MKNNIWEKGDRVEFDCGRKGIKGVIAGLNKAADEFYILDDKNRFFYNIEETIEYKINEKQSL